MCAGDDKTDEDMVSLPFLFRIASVLSLTFHLGLISSTQWLECSATTLLEDLE